MTTIRSGVRGARMILSLNGDRLVTVVAILTALVFAGYLGRL